MIDLTPVFQAIIALVAALITYKLIPWIKAKTTAQQQDNLYVAAKMAVYAAEQIFGSKSGQQKLDYARNALIAAGYNLDTSVLRAAIEEAVKHMNDWNESDTPEEPTEKETPSEDATTPEHPPEEGKEDEPPAPEKEVPAEYLSPANDET